MNKFADVKLISEYFYFIFFTVTAAAPPAHALISLVRMHSLTSVLQAVQPLYCPLIRYKVGALAFSQSTRTKMIGPSLCAAVFYVSVNGFLICCLGYC